jgi:hypothetical protein
MFEGEIVCINHFLQLNCGCWLPAYYDGNLIKHLYSTSNSRASVRRLCFWLRKNCLPLLGLSFSLLLTSQRDINDGGDEYFEAQDFLTLDCADVTELALHEASHVLGVLTYSCASRVELSSENR